jgi:hypothetical protein
MGSGAAVPMGLGDWRPGMPLGVGCARCFPGGQRPKSGSCPAWPCAIPLAVLKPRPVPSVQALAWSSLGPMQVLLGWSWRLGVTARLPGFAWTALALYAFGTYSEVGQGTGSGGERQGLCSRSGWCGSGRG